MSTVVLYAVLIAVVWFAVASVLGTVIGKWLARRPPLDISAISADHPGRERVGLDPADLP